MGKKLEADIQELEIALEHAHHVASENQATMNRYQDSIRQGQARLDEEQKAKAMARNLCQHGKESSHSSKQFRGS